MTIGVSLSVQFGSGALIGPAAPAKRVNCAPFADIHTRAQNRHSLSLWPRLNLNLHNFTCKRAGDRVIVGHRCPRVRADVESL
jgi:hypothetical protein